MSGNNTNVSKIIFGAVYQGISAEEYIDTPVQFRNTIPLAYEFHLYDYNVFIRSKIQEFVTNISKEIVKRTPAPSFQTILDTHNYIEDDLHLQKNSKVAQEIHTYQVYTYSPDRSRLTYLLITSRNYRAASAHRLFLYLEKCFTKLFPELRTNFKLPSETALHDFPDLKEKIKSCQDHRKVDKISEVNAQVDEVKEIMIKNIEDLLERGEKLEDLIFKTEEIKLSADKFHKKAKNLNRCCILL